MMPMVGLASSATRGSPLRRRDLARRLLVVLAVACTALVACSTTSGSVDSARRRRRHPRRYRAVRSAPTLVLAAHREVYSVPASVASDCSGDVTPALSKWISSVPDNSTLMLGKGACYQVDGSLAITNRRNLMLEGNGATLRATTKGHERTHFGIDNSENIIVRNLIVKGANPRAGATRAAYDEEPGGAAWLQSRRCTSRAARRRAGLRRVRVTSSTSPPRVRAPPEGSRASTWRSFAHASHAAGARASPSRAHGT